MTRELKIMDMGKEYERNVEGDKGTKGIEASKKGGKKQRQERERIRESG